MKKVKKVEKRTLLQASDFLEFFKTKNKHRPLKENGPNQSPHTKSKRRKRRAPR